MPDWNIRYHSFNTTLPPPPPPPHSPRKKSLSLFTLEVHLSMSRSTVSVSSTVHTQHLCIRAQQFASCAGMAEGTKKVWSSLHATRAGRLPTFWKETVASTEPTVATTVGRVHIVRLTKGQLWNQRPKSVLFQLFQSSEYCCLSTDRVQRHTLYVGYSDTNPDLRILIFSSYTSINWMAVVTPKLLKRLSQNFCIFCVNYVTSSHFWRHSSQKMQKRAQCIWHVCILDNIPEKLQETMSIFSWNPIPEYGDNEKTFMKFNTGEWR